MKRLLTFALAMGASCGVAWPGVFVQLRTVLGDVQLELYEKDKPATVSNFVAYVESGRWQDMFAHRLVPGFVVQGGGFRVAVDTNGVPHFASVPVFGTIPNEFGVGARFSNEYGTIAMAKLGGDTNSASSQWFLNLADNRFLDANDSNNLFTVFGRVVEGTHVLDIFNSFRPGVATLVITNLGADPFRELPALTSRLTYNDLVFVDVTLLQVDVTAVEGAREISWDGVAGRTNRVEFTPVLPPQWQTLIRTNGVEERMTVRDEGVGPGFRFYRVIVEY